VSDPDIDPRKRPATSGDASLLHAGRAGIVRCDATVFERRLRAPRPGISLRRFGPSADATAQAPRLPLQGQTAHLTTARDREVQDARVGRCDLAGLPVVRPSRPQP